MSKEHHTPPKTSELNIDAAKQYVSSAEKSIIEEPAQAALKKLQAALESTGKTKQELIVLAE
jgi:hypothetical protein